MHLHVCTCVCTICWLISHVCIIMQWIKVVGPDTCATVHAQTWSLSTGYTVIYYNYVYIGNLKYIYNYNYIYKALIYAMCIIIKL